MRTQLDRANQLLAEREVEMKNLVQSERDALQKLKDQLKLLQEEKNILQVCIFPFFQMIVYLKYQVNKVSIDFTDTAWCTTRTCPIAAAD